MENIYSNLEDPLEEPDVEGKNHDEKQDDDEHD